ncbi:MAG TPA: response regulator [Verrucomicrobiae bacterium]|jgi:CheY-like chemotaxis protein|nr:response regulator [Verrucomicrobiae bacterium]
MLQLLIVDDSREDLILAQHVLAQCKLLNPISLFHNANEFISHVEATRQVGPCERPEPALIFLDLIMAPMTGLDVLSYLQRSLYARHCAVVMMSGLKDVKSVREGYQLGAKTFLLKPMTARDVLEVLNGLNDCISIEDVGTGYRLDWKGHVRNAEERLQKASGTRLIREGSALEPVSTLNLARVAS